MPMMAWSSSAPGSTITSAIRVRSSRLRSRGLVLGARHSPGRSAAIASSRSWSGDGGLAARGQVGAGGQAVVEAVPVEPVVRAHRLAAHSTADDALAQRLALARRPAVGAGVVGGQPGLVVQVVRPRDVAVVVVFEQHQPLGATRLAGTDAYGAVRIDPVHHAAPPVG